MAWTDKPTDSQIGTLFHWLSFKMPRAKAVDATKWLQENATRKEVFDEMGRLKALRDSRQLNHKLCFESAVWAEYPAKNLGIEGGTMDKNDG